MTGYIILLLLIAIMGSFAYGAFLAAPWVPIKKQDLARLIALAKPKAGEWLYDLGCGDGRIIITAAKDYKLRALGFEVAWLPFLFTKLRILLSGLSKCVQVTSANFWKKDLSPADIVVCFLTPPAMIKLLPKLKAELKPGARFISYAFPLPEIDPDEVSKPLNSAISIYLYKNIVQPVNETVDI